MISYDCESIIEWQLSMHRQILSAMNIHTTQYGIDTYRDFQRRAEGQKDRLPNIRTHFAVAFTKGEGKDTDTD